MNIKLFCFALVVLVAPFAAAAEQKGGAREKERQTRWIGQWDPSPTQGFHVTSDFKLKFSDDFILAYLREQQFELHLQSEDGEIGAEAFIEKQHLIFMLYADAEDSSQAWLVINRVDKNEAGRTFKVLYKARFHRPPADASPKLE